MGLGQSLLLVWLTEIRDKQHNTLQVLMGLSKYVSAHSNSLWMRQLQCKPVYTSILLFFLPRHVAPFLPVLFVFKEKSNKSRQFRCTETINSSPCAKTTTIIKTSHYRPKLFSSMASFNRLMALASYSVLGSVNFPGSSENNLFCLKDHCLVSGQLCKHVVRATDLELNHIAAPRLVPNFIK